MIERDTKHYQESEKYLQSYSRIYRKKKPYKIPPSLSFYNLLKIKQLAKKKTTKEGRRRNTHLTQHNQLSETNEPTNN